MTEHGAGRDDCGEDLLAGRKRFQIEMTAKEEERPQRRNEAFERVEQEHRDGPAFAERTQRVHRADISGALAANIGAIEEAADE